MARKPHPDVYTSPVVRFLFIPPLPSVTHYSFVSIIFKRVSRSTGSSGFSEDAKKRSVNCARNAFSLERVAVMDYARLRRSPAKPNSAPITATTPTPARATLLSSPVVGSVAALAFGAAGVCLAAFAAGVLAVATVLPPLSPVSLVLPPLLLSVLVSPLPLSLSGPALPPIVAFRPRRSASSPLPQSLPSSVQPTSAEFFPHPHACYSHENGLPGFEMRRSASGRRRWLNS